MAARNVSATTLSSKDTSWMPCIAWPRIRWSLSHKRTLARGAEGEVIRAFVDDKGLLRLEFETREENDFVFRYSPPCHYTWGDDITVEDPYEKKHVEVSKFNRSNRAKILFHSVYHHLTGS